MSSTSLALLLVAVGGLGLAILAGFVKRPAWMTNRQVWTGIFVFVVIGLFGASLQLRESGSEGVESDAPRLPSDVEKSLLAFVDQSAGFPILFSVRGDGASRQRLAQMRGSEIPVFVSEDEMVAPRVVQGSEHERIVRMGVIDGQENDVTTPPEPYADVEVAVARSTGLVFFVRVKVVRLDASTSTYAEPRLFQVPISGTEADVQPVPVRIGLGDIAVNADGSVLAAACTGSVGPAEVCVTDLDTGRSRSVTSGFGSTSDQPSLSDDGRVLVFASSRQNPYGTIETFVARAPRFQPELFTRLSGRADHPAVSFDGRCVAFVHSDRLDDQGDVKVQCDGMEGPVLVTTQVFEVAWFPKSA